MAASLFETYDISLGVGGVGLTAIWLIWVTISRTTPTLPAQVTGQENVVQIVELNQHNVRRDSFDEL